MPNPELPQLEAMVKEKLEAFLADLETAVEDLKGFTLEEFVEQNEEVFGSAEEAEAYFKVMQYSLEDMEGWDHVNVQGDMGAAMLLKARFGEGLPDGNLKITDTYTVEDAEGKEMKVSVFKTGEEGIYLANYSGGETSTWMIRGEGFDKNLE